MSAKWVAVCMLAVLATYAIPDDVVLSNEPIKPIPLEHGQDMAKVALGEKLFHDTRLSGDNTISCASCHGLETGGVDRLQFSVGIEGKQGHINAPTVFNSGYNFVQFWDGRAGSLEEQAAGPVTNPIEMGAQWPDVLTKLAADTAYKQDFAKLYKDGLTKDNVLDAIATFERSLITPNSPFDRYLRGDRNALSKLELEGYEKFKQYGCHACHQGANVGGNMYQLFGVLNNYFEKRGNITAEDMGRYNVTGRESDRHVFKVPSLRMARDTAPYLHDGTAETLRDAVDVMFEFQLGITAPDEDKEAIVAFIESLAGEYKEDRR